MKYGIIFFCFLYVSVIQVSAQGCKKSCATSSGCGTNTMNTADFTSSGEVLACLNNCDAGNPEFGRARVIAQKDDG